MHGSFPACYDAGKIRSTSMNRTKVGFAVVGLRRMTRNFRGSDAQTAAHVSVSWKPIPSFSDLVGQISQKRNLARVVCVVVDDSVQQHIE
jgi:hypothetical protein